MSISSRQTGFTLLEVLVAILVVSLGLLGLAGLQAATLRNNQIAYYRSIAIQQAYDIADRIRANQAGAEAGNYDNLTATIPSDPDCVGNVCSPSQMAAADHAQWNGNNVRLLPGGVGTVIADGNGAYTVTLSWNENTEGGGATQQFTATVTP